MKKFILSVAATLSIMLCTGNVFAARADLIYTEIGIFTAQVYVCDETKNTVVLKLVTPVNEGDTAASLKGLAEYNEIPINTDLVKSGGSFIDLRSVNAYMLDKTAYVVIGRNSYGLKVLTMSFGEV